MKRQVMIFGLVLSLLLAACGANPSAGPTVEVRPTIYTSESTAPDGEAQTVKSDIPAEWDDGGIFSAGYGKAYTKLQSMTPEQKIGQLFLARCPETGGAEQVKTYQPGGYALFKRDFEEKSKQQVVDTIASYQSVSQIPMMIGVDEEGGTVARVSRNPNLADAEFLAPQQVYNNGGMEALKADAETKAQLLASLGINVNFAPVADVSTDPNDFIYDRSLGQDAQTTADYVSQVVTISQQNGVSATAKHFPGYGNNADTHTGVAIDTRPYTSFTETDFLPFEAAISSGVHCILVAHNVMESVDPDLPASLSPAVHHILRQELGFTGLVMTDDLAMGAINAYTGDVDSCVQALLAGNDLLMVNDLPTHYEAVNAALQDGSVSMDVVDHAVFRILAWKYTVGLLND